MTLLSGRARSSTTTTNATPVGILFSVAFPEVAQTINDAIMPTIQSVSEQMISWMTE